MRNVVYKRTLQTLVYLPYFISWVALAGIFLDVLSMDGVVNQLITAWGLNRSTSWATKESSPIRWL